ncbi:carboxymuconolactone decarboxylase family protein [Enterococcus sp. ALS3]|uniref:Carboxymuconolactone decarboxylase family protein n=1 Tax=Enterococcus alishanensis TaxID=1303817 RepID=A0ABS6TCA6_9ENTE|nr:carboxymuconolactone decarboxylase family protein [Enterococcus alishanensis]MBV7390548.1 carboxymuconolactone decarboxylase family protein [Enterococcus alishanensis]
MSLAETQQEMAQQNKILMEAIGSTGQAFKGMAQAINEESAVDAKTKELITLGVAIGARCEGCIITHVGLPIKAGATFEELADVAKIAIGMSGGPGAAYSGKALAYAKEMLENQ